MFISTTRFAGWTFFCWPGGEAIPGKHCGNARDAGIDIQAHNSKRTGFAAKPYDKVATKKLSGARIQQWLQNEK